MPTRGDCNMPMRVFVADDKFGDVINSLKRRGWVRSPHVDSPNFGLKWRNLSKINFRILRGDQFVNHLRNSQELSNKACLVAHLGFYQRHHQIFIGSGSGRHPFDDPGTFFPRSWDLSTEGGTSLLRAFAVSASVALLRQAAAHGKGNADSSPPPSTGLVAAAAIVERYANFLRGARHSPEMEPVGPGHCRPEEGGQEVIISRATPGSGRGRSRDDSCVCRRREGVIGHHHHGKPDPELTARFAPPAEGARGSREGGGEEEDRAGPWVEGEKGEGSAAEAWTQPADGWAQGQEQMSEATLAPQDMDDNVVEVGGPEWTSVVSLWENVLSGRATVSRETATTYTTTTNTTTKDWCKMEKNVGLPWTEGEQVYSSSVHREEGEKQGILSASQDLPAGAEAGARERLCRGQKRLGNKGEKFLRPRAGAEAGAEAGGGGGTKARVGGPGAEAALLRSSFVGWGGFRKQCAELVRSLEELDPQAGAMMGEANAWAVKPPGMSCGRGVVMLSSLRELVKACRHLGNRAVVQKYVERPLLIKGRKFDIRQWVLLTSLNPLVIWGFGESYLRFSSRPFTLKADSLSDSLIHLCNHSIQKDAPTSALAPAPAVPAPTPATIPFPSLADDTSCPTNPLAPHPGGRDCFTRVNVAPGGEDGPWSAGAPPCSPSPGEAGGDSFEAVGNMWGAGQFREHLMERFQGDDVYTRVVLPNIRRVVVQTLLAVQESLERKGRGLEWFGFDLILTEDLQAKLIEVNVSPDVSHRYVRTYVHMYVPLPNYAPLQAKGLVMIDRPFAQGAQVPMMSGIRVRVRVLPVRAPVAEESLPKCKMNS
ncbi:unnamed protein product, partial [Discosporangium mesarthrocarpum]